MKPEATLVADSSEGLTVGFVDLAGYTALTEFHGDILAADLAARFAQLANESLEPGERLVKTIGDAVMLCAPTPVDGVALVGRVCAGSDAEPAFRSCERASTMGLWLNATVTCSVQRSTSRAASRHKQVAAKSSPRLPSPNPRPQLATTPNTLARSVSATSPTRSTCSNLPPAPTLRSAPSTPSVRWPSIVPARQHGFPTAATTVGSVRSPALRSSPPNQTATPVRSLSRETQRSGNGAHEQPGARHHPTPLRSAATRTAGRDR